MPFSLPFGTIVDQRYEIVSLLGEGGLGAVYKAKQDGIDRFIAIKFLHHNAVDDEENQERFRREGLALSRLNHPSIPRLYQFGFWNEIIPYIAMEYLPGSTLKRELLRLGKLPWQQALSIAKQVASAMEYAHDEGIVHRDLKCENIVLISETGNEPEIKVFDFGLARFTSSENPQKTLTETGFLLGTVSYMSPEQCRGEKADRRADIYSLGCILFHMLTGELPFTADAPIAVIQKHLNEPVPPLPRNLGLPSGLAKIIQNSMEKSAAKRYQSMKELLRDLKLVEEGEEPVIHTQGNSSNAAKKFSRRLAYVPAIVAFLLLCIGAFFYMVREQQSAHRSQITEKIGPESKQKKNLHSGLKPSPKVEHEYESCLRTKDKSRVMRLIKRLESNGDFWNAGICRYNFARVLRATDDFEMSLQVIDEGAPRAKKTSGDFFGLLMLERGQASFDMWKLGKVENIRQAHDDFLEASRSISPSDPEKQFTAKVYLALCKWIRDNPEGALLCLTEDSMRNLEVLSQGTVDSASRKELFELREKALKIRFSCYVLTQQKNQAMREWVKCKLAMQQTASLENKSLSIEDYIASVFPETAQSCALATALQLVKYDQTIFTQEIVDPLPCTIAAGNLIIDSGSTDYASKMKILSAMLKAEVAALRACKNKVQVNDYQVLCAQLVCQSVWAENSTTHEIANTLIIEGKNQVEQLLKFNVFMEKFLLKWHPENSLFRQEYLMEFLFPATKSLEASEPLNVYLLSSACAKLFDKFKLNDPLAKITLYNYDAQHIYPYLQAHFAELSALELRARAITNLQNCIEIAANNPGLISAQEEADLINWICLFLTEFPPEENYKGSPSIAMKCVSHCLMEERHIILYAHALVKLCYFISPKDSSAALRKYVEKSSVELISDLRKAKTLKGDEKDAFYSKQIQPPRTTSILVLAKFVDDKLGDRLFTELNQSLPFSSEDYRYRMGRRLLQVADVLCKYSNPFRASYYRDCGKKILETIPEESPLHWTLALVDWSDGEIRAAEGRLDEAKKAKEQALKRFENCKNMESLGNYTKALLTFDYAYFLAERMQKNGEARHNLSLASVRVSKLTEPSISKEAKSFIEQKITWLSQRLGSN